MPKKNIVILGGGFGGIVAAQRIAKEIGKSNLSDKYDVTVIDRNEAQVYTPILYEHAAAPAGGNLPKNIQLHIPSLLKGLPAKFMQGEVAEIDLMNGDIHLKAGEEIKAEFLVIALGSESNYFGIPGLAEHSTPLKTFADASKINDAISLLLKGGASPRIAVGGAGANGIELASQIKSLHENCDVTIIEAMPEILPGFTGGIVSNIKKRLIKIGVTVLTNSKITGVDANIVKLDGGKTVPFDLMVWTGGIKAPDLVSKLPLRSERGKPVAELGMACVPQTPDLKLYPMVYVLGDSVCFYDPKTKRPMPATAPIAITQAEVVAHNVIEEIKKAEMPNYVPKPMNYEAKEFPYVVPVGGSWGVAKIGPFILVGFGAWIFKQFVELDYLMEVMSFGKALGAWLK